ncbi:MAG: hypothetical protein KIT56_09045 [Gammaproteobacteria bacterium]|nr:hypothetical protein [Gammaproteobacteria bacterium]MCW5584002.1 hypothetical protein [Gammaproteobacteria bacterium]
MNVSINWNLNAYVETIDFNKNTLTIAGKKSKEIEFTNIVNCEGEKRKTVDCINKAMRIINQNEFKFSNITNEETYHMAVKMKLNKLVTMEYNSYLNGMKKNYESDKNVVEDFVNSEVLLSGKIRKVNNLSFLYDPNIYLQEKLFQ